MSAECGCVSVQTLILVRYRKLEFPKFANVSEMHDPFKNPQIVVFVYITDGATHGPCEVGDKISATLSSIVLFT